MNNNHNTIPNPLTKRETEVLEILKNGKCYYEAAHLLNIQERTVHFHAKNIREKLDANNITHAVVIALRNKFIEV